MLPRREASQIRPNARPASRSRVGRAGAPAGRELVGFVGDGARPGRDPEGAVRRPRGHAWPRPTAAAMPPAWPRGRPRRRRRRRRARRRRHAERGRQRAGRHRHRARRAARRIDQRVRPDPRAAQRPDRGDRRAARRAGRGSGSSRSASASVNGRYFLFHVGLGFDAAVVHRSSGEPGSSATPATRSSSTRRSRRGSATTTGAARASRCTSPTAPSSTTATSAICLNTNPYTYLGNRPFNLAPEATLDRGLAMFTLRSLSPLVLLGLRRPALGFGRDLRRQRRVRPAHRRRQAHGERLRPVPLPGRRRLPRRDRALEFRHEPEILRLVQP